MTTRLADALTSPAAVALACYAAGLATMIGVAVLTGGWWPLGLAVAMPWWMAGTMQIVD